MVIKEGAPMLAEDILRLNFLPVGTILMYDGTSWADDKTIPGWVKCDGTVKTVKLQNGSTVTVTPPNLVNRFIRGGIVSSSSGGSDSQSITLTTANLPSHAHSITDKTHTHVQDAHNHTQDSHNHTQDAHNHTQSSHTHTQDEHNHTQDAHNHTQNAHGHTDSGHTHTYTKANGSRLEGNLWDNEYFTQFGTDTTGTTGSSKANIQNTTASNIAVTATNQAATATNQATTAVNTAATATNQAVTATNQAATATNQAAGTGLTATDAAGSGSAFTVNTVPVYYTLIYIKKVA
ncbi:MAG: hypothetical protein LBQ83_01510 [Candidatus Margulisbacteria bacterium]|jgi:hypothetical protein|nr:hypothetical protein [Candidatus Margulisiibacteriota bacterium]